jgi:AbrB family looped-hinge helix DNA binding protein
METTKLSSKGQLIIPKPIRTAHHWETGQELIVIETGDGVMLKPKKAFQETCIEEVASCLQYSGKAKNLDDMEQAIKHGIKEQFHGSS